jgi:hypothetical protein
MPGQLSFFLRSLLRSWLRRSWQLRSWQPRVLLCAIVAAAMAACSSAAAPEPARGADVSPRPHSRTTGRGARTLAPSARATSGGSTATGRFWSGTDGFDMPVAGTGPYAEPVLGGAYGGYIGMAGNWAQWQGCGGQTIWSAANASQAATNFARYRKGVGTADFWFMAGPGTDPRYNGTVSEAADWGRQQAAQALADLHGPPTLPIIWMDVERPGKAPQFTPAPDNGWRSVYTSPCSGQVRLRHIAPAVDRGVIDGFASYVTAHSPYKPGVYSAPRDWKAIFGTGRASKIPGLYEWTYTAYTSNLANSPSGWCLRSTSTCARFFGGQDRGDPTALMWQWSGGGGSRNGYGDFDQIDGARAP